MISSVISSPISPDIGDGPTGDGRSSETELPDWEPTVSEDVKDPAALLVQAVGMLRPEDRDAVLTWLLRRDARRFNVAAMGQTGLGGQLASPARLVGDFFTAQAPAAGRAPHGAQQVVPVRFPTDQHAQLREWCAEHGFSMATVIRGLVARFLEMQLPERN
jgi:hypothetical protein